MSASQSVSGSSSPPPQHDSGLQERVSAAVEKLAASAAELNVVSDELGKPIPAIDTALQGLNLGVSAWVEFERRSDPDYEFFSDRSIGYARVSGTWGIAIRTRSGTYDSYETEEWRFNDAPRSYRLEALDKLPELLEQLARVANDTASELKRKLVSTKQVATTISQMALASPARRK